MHLSNRLARGLFLVAAFTSLATALPAAATAGNPAPAFHSSPTLKLEAETLIRLLEEVHYNRDAVTPASYAEVIPDYMGDLDGQHLFFLKTDKDAFLARHKAATLYNNIRYLGQIDPAYTIFDVYKKRVSDRVAWIAARLDRKLNLDAKDTYTLDRTKAEWPATPAQADTLWDQRLRFELIKEILNKKTPEEARDIVGKRYQRMLKNLDDLDSGDLSEMFLTAITGLYDPHSNYFSAATYEDFGIQMRLQLVGIGALLSLEEDQCVIKEIIPGGPADLDKQLRPNDTIVAVAQDGGEPVEVIGMKLRKIVDMIRGAKGTRVHLTVESGSGGSATRKEIVLTRNVVNLDSARAHAAIFQVPDSQGRLSPLGVITLPAFYGPDMTGETKAQNSATKDIAELIKRLKAAHVKGIVLDLRRNGGGLLSEAISLTGLFIPRGPVVQVRSYSGEIKVDEDTDPSVAYDGPLAVLVSRFSASASEIVTGALQNYGRAVVIGDSSTHGKGTVQTIVEMKNFITQPDDSPEKTGAAKVTVQKFYLPDGASTQLKGVVPDIVLPSIDDYLPIGESDLPHALPWDVIPSSIFDGHPLPPSYLAPLRAASLARQTTLPEFDYLKRYVEWFKNRRAEKTVSLNLKERTLEKKEDAAFKKKMDAERKKLAESDYKFTEEMLGPPPPPRIKAKKKADDDDDSEDDWDEDDNERYAPVDIPLRESFRVLMDELTLDPAAKAEAERAAHTARITPKPAIVTP